MSEDTSLKPLYPLIPAQLAAVQPEENVWLSASAGTGKTQVLTARVIRLLLEEGVEPENLLCITFTKAGAAEMAERINQRLASWVQLEDTALFKDMEAIGAKSGPEYRQRASELFARVLDAPGGGLQILTIHSFCQSLLGSFPEEAGLVPGFKPIEGAEQQTLLREALASMVIAAEQADDQDLIRSLQKLSLAMGEEAAEKFLAKCAAVPDVMEGIPDGAGAISWARRVAGVEFDCSPHQMLESALADSEILREDIKWIADENLAWGKGKADSRGGKRAHIIYNWLAMNPAQRAVEFQSLHRCWSNGEGEAMISSKGYTPMDDYYRDVAQRLYDWTKDLTDQMVRADYAERLASALLVGKRLAQYYAHAKHARGVIDFDDMIRRTAALLNSGAMAQWVRFKLDKQIDHILVDEAQDTNKAQWDIVAALASDFFSGLGQRSEKIRTIFSVGDFKQAIYGFQGTAPERYEEAGKKFGEDIKGAGGELARLTLSQSFRSTTPVLQFVNALIDEAGHANFGISDEVPDHYSRMPAEVGMVELLAPVSPKSADEERDDDEESWVPNQKRDLAERLADYAKELIDQKPWLATQKRPLEPRDIMFLLRSRGDVASLLVAQLHERRVPVAGVDRLRLAQPLVVQDLLAVIRFVLQPLDDLSLACIMVSPIIGWTQEKLLEYGYRGERKVSLWQHLRGQDAIADELEPLRAILDAADFVTVYDFLEQILSGPIGARRKFVARLGTEALVPMEEMLNTALLFQEQQGGGLQSFLHWFEKGENIIKREGEGGANEVRVMTVHGSKGLQAPVVILADATSDPRKKPDRTSALVMDEGKNVPLLAIRSAEKSGRLQEIVELQETRELEEHRRLLYVAVTRAEERLIMGGALSGQNKGVPPADSWFAMMESAMRALGHEWEDDARWGQVMRHVGEDGVSAAPPATRDQSAKDDPAPLEAPSWLFTPAPQESRPPRPLVPSRLEDDDYGDAPPSLAMQAAATRGKLLHALFERITDEASLDAAAKWLDITVRDAAIDKRQILEAVTAVVRNPEWADFFKPEAQAEVPLAALVGETVITGRIDRMIVEPGRVRIIDFKTGRSVPEDAQGVIIPYLRQMAHYVAALETIFPDSSVEASLLFTHTPRLVRLPDAVLQPHKPASTV
jgi:ATP-dependent helicase/nuclease subunit A